MLMIFTLLCLWNAATAAELRIKSTNNFINFLNTLSSSSNHSGTTVLLDTDLDFSGDLSSKISLANRFNGVFDGQGHTISNLIMNTQRGQMGGIFSSSNGLTVKNVVIDPSCYAESSFKTTGNFIYAYVGTVTNECFEKDEECILEGIVNMANVTFKGNITNNTLYMGGLFVRND